MNFCCCGQLKSADVEELVNIPGVGRNAAEAVKDFFAPRQPLGSCYNGFTMNDATLEYVSDEAGNLKSVIVPIEVWNDIAAELETRYLLQGETMKRRLLEAKERQEGLSLEKTLEKLGV